jgi:radical SAM superfamily enzyme YgiQ (UPF0313 family)
MATSENTQAADKTTSRTVALVNFYNPKALAIRYLEAALTKAGFDVLVLHIGGYRGARAGKPTEEGIREFFEKLGGEPLWIGLSVISSFLLETAEEVSDTIRRHSKAPLVWGGVIASLLPERCLAHCDYVVRGEGEAAAVDFSQRLAAGADVADMPNLAYMSGGQPVVNPVRPFETDLGSLGLAELGLPNKYFLDDADGKLYHTDTCVDSYSYETAASRGCPFSCSYCSVANVRRLYTGISEIGGYTRFRPVGDVIDELKAAKARMKKLSFVRFWDEIFSTDPAWIDEFTTRYKAEIGLPFEAWTHPLKADGEVIAKLRRAGMRSMVMGIQSGSPGVRRDAFRRAETEGQILAAAEALSKARVPFVTFDFILGHPLETIEQLKESYDLCTKLPGKFSLQLHGLIFLPGTDIVEEAIKRGVYTREAMEGMMYKPMEHQYSLWNEAKNASGEIEFWYNLIFMTQFPFFRAVARGLAGKSGDAKARAKAARWYKLSKYFMSVRHIRQKGLNVVLERRK